MIYVFDDFFSRDDQLKILHLMGRPKWMLSGGGPTSPFWHMDGLEQEDYFSVELFNKINENVEGYLDGFVIERCYANGQTAGLSGVPHYDDGELTFLYYPNLDWKPDWGGHLNFLDDDGNIQNMIQFKPNRALIFSANILHYADAPARHYNGLRISLAYKLKKTK